MEIPGRRRAAAKGYLPGATLIDTAAAYCTEGVVGEAVKDMRDRVFIATKVSPQHFRSHDVISAADDSLKRLRIDCIDVYQLDWPNPAIPIEETMGAMDRLVEVGKIRFIGVSNFSVAQLREAKAASRNKIVSNQVPDSLADGAIEHEVLRYCQENGVTVSVSPV